MSPKTRASKPAKSSGIEFGAVLKAAAIPARGGATKYDEVVQRAQHLAIGDALPFQAPSTSSLTRLKKRLAAIGYALTTQTNGDNHPTNPGGVTAFVKNDVGAGVEPIESA